MTTPPEPQIQPQQFTQEANKVIDIISGELQDVFNETHTEYQALLETLDMTRGRLLANAEIQRELAIQHAKHTLDFTKQQIESDYQLGKEDVKEKIYADLRKKKKEIKEVLDRLQSKGLQVNSELNSLNDIKIPNKKREKKSVQKVSYNFKVPEQEARQDIAIIRSLAEEFDQTKK